MRNHRLLQINFPSLLDGGVNREIKLLVSVVLSLQRLVILCKGFCPHGTFPLHKPASCFNSLFPRKKAFMWRRAARSRKVSQFSFLFFSILTDSHKDFECCVRSEVWRFWVTGHGCGNKDSAVTNIIKLIYRGNKGKSETATLLSVYQHRSIVTHTNPFFFFSSFLEEQTMLTWARTNRKCPRNHQGLLYILQITARIHKA